MDIDIKNRLDALLKKIEDQDSDTATLSPGISPLVEKLLLYLGVQLDNLDITTELEKLKDVEIEGPAHHQALVYDAEKEKWINDYVEGGAAGATKLDELTDVHFSGLEDGESLVYDSASSKWINKMVDTSIFMEDIVDTDIEEPRSGQVLVYDGDEITWKNSDALISAESKISALESADSAIKSSIESVAARATALETRAANLEQEYGQQQASLIVLSSQITYATHVAEGALNNEAAEYQTNVQYNPSDYCIYQYGLYRCIGQTNGAWNAAKWERIKVCDEIKLVKASAASAVETANNAAASAASAFEKAEDAIGVANSAAVVASDASESAATAYVNAATALESSSEAVRVATSALDSATGAYEVAGSALSSSSEAYSLASMAAASASEAWSVASSAAVTAESALGSAESAFSLASTAKESAEAAYVTADSAVSIAIGASADASEAVSSAQAAYSAAQGAKTSAQSAIQTASSAMTLASAAATSAQIAIEIANAAKTSADLAYGTAESALSSAEYAYASASSAFYVAGVALADASAAGVLAQSATQQAVDAARTANSAITDAGTAITTANSAFASASDAITFAQAAQSSADNAILIATGASDSAAAAYTSAQTAISTANSAKTSAQSAYTMASEAKSSAATAISTANSAKESAETAYSTANSALESAAIAFETADSALSSAQSAYTIAGQAKTSAQSAYTTAEGALTSAQTAYEIAGSALTSASSAYTYATQAKASAQTAYNTATAAASDAADALLIAGVASSDAAAALNSASTAISTANSALTSAQSAYTVASEAKTSAQGAYTIADEAKTSAGTAISTANSAKTSATTAYNTATAAKTSAEAAYTTADSAYSIAQLADATATSALTVAEAAQASADSAYSIATTALASSSSAYSKAATAQTSANTAITNAATAQTSANSALTNAATAQSSANTAITKANTAQSSANTALTNAATAQATADSAYALASNALPNTTKYGSSITVSINSTNYKITTTLKDQDGNTLGNAQTIDLPLESVVVNGTFDSANKKIVLTLQNGNTVDIPVGDLVAGLQTEITDDNKLNSDLVTDSNQTHKFVTAAQISKLNGIAAGAEVNVQSDWSVSDNTSDAFIKNKPDIPTVNNAVLTIQKNGTTVNTFTANASSDVTANIVVPTKTSDLTNDGSDGTSTYLESDETAYRSSGIPYGQVDSTSTSTAYTATVPGITNLYDGVCMWLKNGVVNSAANFTININNLGAKPVYQNVSAATAETTIFQSAYTFMFIYDSTRVSGGCWVLNRGYNSDQLGIYVRTNKQTMPVSGTCGRYRLLFTSADGTKYVPATTSTSTNTYTNRDVNQTKINPFGRIFWYASTTILNADEYPAVGVLHEQYYSNLGYSFAKGTSLAMTTYKPVYLKCAPQADGSAIIDSTTPWVQDLPTTEDGKIYIFLGVAYDATGLELQLDHPIYYYKDGCIRPWTNQIIPTVNNATLTIQKNGTTVNTFTANASSNVTANITVPTSLSDLSDDSTHRVVSDTEKAKWNATSVYKELTTEDLDNVKEVGFYVGKAGNTCANKPSGVVQFGLQVVKLATDAVYYKQILTRPTASPGDEYVRTCVTGTWGEWAKRVDFSGSYNDLNDQPTIPDISGKVSKSGDTMTGELLSADRSIRIQNITAARVFSVEAASGGRVQLHYATSGNHGIYSYGYGDSLSNTTTFTQSPQWIIGRNAEGAVFISNWASKGNSTQPIYINSEGSATACTYSLEKSVPSDAVFTDEKVKITNDTSTNQSLRILLGISNNDNTVTESVKKSSPLLFNPSTGVFYSPRIIVNSTDANVPLIIRTDNRTTTPSNGDDIPILNGAFKKTISGTDSSVYNSVISLIGNNASSSVGVVRFGSSIGATIITGGANAKAFPKTLSKHNSDGAIWLAAQSEVHIYTNSVGTAASFGGHIWMNQGGLRIDRTDAAAGTLNNMYVIIGNGTAQSVAGSAKGTLRLYNQNSAGTAAFYVNLDTNALSENQYIHLPDASGTIQLQSTMSVAKLVEGTEQISRTVRADTLKSGIQQIIDERHLWREIASTTSGSSFTFDIYDYFSGAKFPELFIECNTVADRCYVTAGSHGSGAMYTFSFELNAVGNVKPIKLDTTGRSSYIEPVGGDCLSGYGIFDEVRITALEGYTNLEVHVYMRS